MVEGRETADTEIIYIAEQAEYIERCYRETSS